MNEIKEPELVEQNQPEPDMVLSPEAQYYLQQAGKWASFLGIVGFVFCGLILIAALFGQARFTVNSSGDSNTTYRGIGASIGYILLDILYFFISYHLFTFGKKTKNGVALIDNDQVTKGLSSLKSYFKITGVFLIVLFVLMALILIGAIIGGAIGNSIK